MRIALICIMLCLTVGARGQVAQPTGPAAPPPAAFERIEPRGQAIAKAQLLEMYRAALADRAAGVDLDKLYAAHQLIEQYFEATGKDQRAKIVEQLDGMGIEPNVLGRIVRIRMDWPALAGGVYYINETIGPHEVHYFLGVPQQYDRSKPWPLIVKLPTAQAFVTDPPPAADQVAEIYKGWMKEELASHPDAIVLMPLLNFAELYGPSYAGMNSVIQPMLQAAGRVNIDPARVYLIGHSMAAHAVWNLGLHYATYFAAINPMAGSANDAYQRVRLVNLCNTLPVVWHDAEDPMLKVDASRQLVRILRDKKIDVDYEETKGVGHGPKAELVEKMYQKLRARVRELYPQRVIVQSDRPDTIFNRLDWVQMYQPLASGKEKPLWFTRGTGKMIVYENSFAIDATRQGNTIDVHSDNVESMRFYLNDQMVDFAKPVIIRINGRTRFEGMVKPSIDEMLKDQVFLGRGWRYFTGIVDIDFGDAAGARPATTGRSTTGSSTRPTSRRGTIEIVPKGGGPPVIYRPKEE